MIERMKGGFPQSTLLPHALEAAPADLGPCARMDRRKRTMLFAGCTSSTSKGRKMAWSLQKLQARAFASFKATRISTQPSQEEFPAEE
jgi:hypothetical protein